MEDRYLNGSSKRHRLVQICLPGAEPRGRRSCSSVDSFALLLKLSRQGNASTKLHSDRRGWLPVRKVLFYTVQAHKELLSLVRFSASRLFHTHTQNFKLSRAVTAGSSSSGQRCPSSHSRSLIGQYETFVPAYNDPRLRSGTRGVGSEKRKTRARISIGIIIKLLVILVCFGDE